MSTARPTGYVRVRDRKDGPVYYAKLKLADGTQPQRKIGPAWLKRSRPPVGYFTLTQAEAELRKMLDGENPTVNIAPTHVTFKQACEEWLADRGRECRASTMYDYRGTVRSRLLPFFGETTPIESITTERVDALRDEMAEAGLAGRTINKTLALAHGIFRLAMRRHRLGGNPVANAQRSKQRRRKLEQWLVPEEVLALVRAAHAPQDAVLYEVAAWTGLRWGELRALRWGDVDFTGGYLHVNRNLPVKGEEGDPKSGKPRAVPLWDQAAAALDGLSHRAYFTADDDYVFVNTTGDAIGYDETRRRFLAARDLAGLASPRPHERGLTFHDLRHTYGTIAARAYGDLREVQEYMGHESITTTELYAHFIPRRDAADRGTAGLQALLGARSAPAADRARYLRNSHPGL